jgi:hypothetical protein
MVGWQVSRVPSSSYRPSLLSMIAAHGGAFVGVSKHARKRKRSCTAEATHVGLDSPVPGQPRVVALAVGTGSTTSVDRSAGAITMHNPPKLRAWEAEEPRHLLKPFR